MSQFSCIKCLASLHAAYVTHGIDAELLEETLTEVIKCYEEHEEENCEGLPVMQKLRYQRKIANMTLVLSLLQRRKTLG
jgi:hypothetical protein